MFHYSHLKITNDQIVIISFKRLHIRYAKVNNMLCDLYMFLQLGDGLIYENVDGVNVFPHFYGPSKSFVPLTLDMVVKAEKITSSNGQFDCSLLK